MDTIGYFPHFDLDNVKNSAPTCQTADEGGVIIPRFHFKFIAFPFNAGDTFLYTRLAFQRTARRCIQKDSFPDRLSPVPVSLSGELLFYSSWVIAFWGFPLFNQRTTFSF